jgi:hypothetical protein
MSRDIKYIGMDVHKEATVIAVLNSSGKLVMESIVETDVRWKVSLSTVTAVRGKPEQVGKLAGCEPRELAAIIHLAECQASVALEAVPAQIGFLESFAAHGLHGIPEDRFHISDFYEHVRSESTRQIWPCP